MFNCGSASVCQAYSIFWVVWAVKCCIISTDFSSLLDLFLGILNAYGGKCNFYWVVIFLNFGSGFLLFFDF